MNFNISFLLSSVICSHPPDETLCHVQAWKLEATSYILTAALWADDSGTRGDRRVVDLGPGSVVRATDRPHISMVDFCSVAFPG